MSISVYMDGDMYVVVETGQPQDNVYIGCGDTPEEAVDNLTMTSSQSVGLDCGKSDGLFYALSCGWITDDDLPKAPDTAYQRARARYISRNS